MKYVNYLNDRKLGQAVSNNKKFNRKIGTNLMVSINNIVYVDTMLPSLNLISEMSTVFFLPST